MTSQGFVGDLLIREGVVDAAGLARGLETQARDGTTLGRALAKLGLAGESAVSAAIASALHPEFLARPRTSPRRLALLPSPSARSVAPFHEARWRRALPSP